MSVAPVGLLWSVTVAVEESLGTNPKGAVMAMWKYVCMSTTCGHVEFSTFAPAASKRCPVCGGTMKRETA